ncbi:lipocalin-like domain-containing protein [Mycobacteroides sp. LB1]|uniref:lipocalin-like domain-containing protein n=1 Tax=Mycobacteroides sp. LB1 TaxID=2750814 RepID=UPI0015DF226B|nr:lipocalin-like domain-containing protein [Mycobacteroides sp. LB1]
MHASETEPVRPRDFVGQWRLESYYDLDENGATGEGPLGQSPIGLLYYGAEGALSVSMMRGEQVPGAVPFMGYAGHWQVDGPLVLHRITVCSNPAWAGTVQTRQYDFDGDKLTLIGALQQGGKQQRRILAWRRA